MGTIVTTGRYASSTTVGSEQSRAEIERTLTRYGATAFGYYWENQRAVVTFRLKDRIVRLRVPLPDPNADEFTVTDNGRARAAGPRRELYEQATRQRWRAVLLVIKAKLEAAELGISSIEREFLADTVMPDGETVGDWAIPQLDAALRTGDPLPLLPAVAGPSR